MGLSFLQMIHVMLPYNLANKRHLKRQPMKTGQEHGHCFDELLCFRDHHSFIHGFILWQKHTSDTGVDAGHVFMHVNSHHSSVLITAALSETLNLHFHTMTSSSLQNNGVNLTKPAQLIFHLKIKINEK